MLFNPCYIYIYHYKVDINLKYFLSIVIPAFNEEFRILGTLGKIHKYFSNKGFDFEIIVVDDGSTDNTVKVIEGFKERLSPDRHTIKIIKNGKNKGKGYSVRKGVLSAKGRYVLFSDADLSTPIEEFEKLFKYLQNGYNISIASRELKGSNIKIRQCRIREYMGKTFNFIIRKVTKLDFMDTQCGFKCFDRDSIEKVFPNLKINDFSFDIEILYLASKLGLKIKEVPVTWENSAVSKVNPIKDSVKMFLNLIRIKKIHSN